MTSPSARLIGCRRSLSLVLRRGHRRIRVGDVVGAGGPRPVGASARLAGAAAAETAAGVLRGGDRRRRRWPGRGRLPRSRPVCPYVVIEKNAGVGGTWFENRYPGARVDSPSRTYTHIFGADFEYPNPFCEQRREREVLQLGHRRVRGARQHRVQHRSQVGDLGRGRQGLGDRGGRARRAAHLARQRGDQRRRASSPDRTSRTSRAWPTFEGPVFHTARWPGDLDLTGKRVAVIGSGCTSYQMIPELVKMAGHTYLFQRTPNWCFDVAGYRSPYPPQVNWLDRNFPYFTNFTRFRSSWLYGPGQASAPRSTPIRRSRTCTREAR